MRDWPQPGRRIRLLSLLRAVHRSELVFGWFASWHTFLPITFAWLMRRPSVLVAGGYDTASVPQIGYGIQHHWLLGPISRWVLRRATREMALGHRTLVEALQAMGERNAVPELARLASQLRAAHQQGIPVAQTLTAQAEALREQKRLRIVARGGEALTQMALPVALFILPTLFVVLLVPAAVQVISLGQ